MKKINEFSVLIMTYDGFSELWEPLLKTYKQIWKNIPEHIYISNNRIVLRDLECSFLNNEDEVSWSDSIIKSLNKINTKYVFCVFDDIFPKCNSKFDIVDEYIDRCIRSDWDYLRIHNSPKNGVYYNDGLNHLVGDLEYRTSLNFSIIKRDVLLSILDEKEDAWEFERNSVERSLAYENFYVARDDIISYHNLVVKGKYNPLAKKNIEKQINYEFQINKIKKMNYCGVYKRKFHEIVYAVKRIMLDNIK
jgi:hypothetical protein